jgi:peptidoglycan/xylan/chitin deacetylase (PgdA/CDA1 family)
MILMFHKIDIIVPTKWWVSRATFQEQMDALADWHVVSLSEYSSGSREQCVITFDDAYENIYNHAFPILREKGYPFEVFVNGDLVGKWNRFDRSEPLTRFCGLHHLQAMSAAGGRIQWHTSSHPDLTRLSEAEAEKEMTVPEALHREFGASHFRWLAYPYGAHSPAIVELAKSKFDGALSVCDGLTNDRYQLNRIVVTEETLMPEASKCYGPSKLS